MFDSYVVRLMLLLVLSVFPVMQVLASDRVADIHVGIASNFSEVRDSSVNPFGNDYRNGITLALQDTKQKLLAKNMRIVLHEFDYGADPLNALKAARKAVASPVVAVIGYNASGEALLAGRIHQDSGLPMITPTATATRLSSLGEYVYPIALRNAHMAQLIVRTASRLQAKRAVIIEAIDCAYCADLASDFSNTFALIGGKTVARFRVLKNARAFPSIVSALAGLKYDVVVVPNHEITSARIVSALCKAGIYQPYLGGDGWENANGHGFFQIVHNPECRGYFVTDWHPDMPDVRSKGFVKQYRDAFNREPNDDAVMSYDAFQLLVTAMLKTQRCDRKNVQRALQSIRQYSGPSGDMLFQGPGAPIRSMALVGLDFSKKRFNFVKKLEPQ